MRTELPPGTTISVVRDSSLFIRESLEDVQQTLILGGILTILIVFCFINSWRSTVITGVTLPISVMSSFIIMKALGMSINVMTMMALSLAIGLLIDDAIVVRENIVRHLERGEDHLAAARNGTSEIGLAVFATTMSIVAVFVPVAFMKGIVGRFFFQFGMTVAFAVLVSLFVSFTLDPMLSSRWHDPAITAKGKRKGLAKLLEGFNGWFDRAADGYRRMIGWALDHRKTVLGIALAAFAGGIITFGSLQSAFFPDIDSGEFNVTFKTAPDASIAESRGRLEALLGAIGTIPPWPIPMPRSARETAARSAAASSSSSSRSGRRGRSARGRCSRISAGASSRFPASSPPSRRSTSPVRARSHSRSTFAGRTSRALRPMRPSSATRCMRSRGSGTSRSAWSTTSPNTGLSWTGRRRRAPG